MAEHNDLGKIGEDLAVDYLQKNDMKLLIFDINGMEITDF